MSDDFNIHLAAREELYNTIRYFTGVDAEGALAWALGFPQRDSVLECSSPLELSVGLRTC